MNLGLIWIKFDQSLYINTLTCYNRNQAKSNLNSLIDWQPPWGYNVTLNQCIINVIQSYLKSWKYKNILNIFNI